MKSPHRVCVSLKGGFTLLEVVLALTLTTLFMGSLFAIVRTSIVSSTEIEKIQREDKEWMRFVKLCRQTFENLSPTASMELTHDSGISQLAIFFHNDSFPLGLKKGSDQDTTLKLIPEPNQTSDIPTYFLGLFRQDNVPTQSSRARGTIDESKSIFAPADERGYLFLPLLSDIQSLQWRVYDETKKTWELVLEEGKRPPLLELTVLKNDSLIPHRMVFLIPNAKLREATSGNAPTATSNSPSNAQSENGNSGSPPGNGGGQNNQGGGRGNGGGQNNQGGGRGNGGGQNNQGGGRGNGGGQNNQGGGRGNGGGGSNLGNPNNSTQPNQGSRG